jgi:adenylate cyclase
VAAGWPIALGLLAALLWWLPPAGGRGLTAAFIGGALLLGTALALLRAGLQLPTAAALLTGLCAALLRHGFDAALALRERARLRAAFGGYVSPQVLQRLLDGELDPTRPDGPREMAFLFADLRGFTTRGEEEPALATVTMLNRYYDAVIAPVHEAGGMVDNFRGDGIMVVFGAPQALAEPARSAVQAAGGMVRALRALNRQLQAEGRPVLEMGLGVALGEAVAGQIGSRSRYDYTAIGDAVNVAARLQDQCRGFNAAAVVSAAVADRLQPGDADITELGELDLRGHTPIRACMLTWAPGGKED